MTDQLRNPRLRDQLTRHWNAQLRPCGDVHLDVRAAPGLRGEEWMAALEAECDRLVALGATRVRRHEPAPPFDGGHILTTDPEGDEFCLD
ncbi:hypothetical protein GCM10023108_50650 [Saccharopolyspora hordei]|uniref:Glyoxalase-like domain-containing protein n=1 Tax=Saccharopolyspora hordei TaxID=1838 RepID=A0A853AF11_9PSEU|nr:VOC family protein [Saccharopolyspora hordei]NYI82548.1 hypothetical protein [Saccharopolyspora hordei]